jgi:hypothetical protein
LLSAISHPVVPSGYIGRSRWQRQLSKCNVF